MMRRRGGMLY